MDKKKEILKAARKFFFVYGYSKTSLKDIAEAVGTSKSSLYLYFQNKQSIFAQLVQHESKQLFNLLKNGVDARDGVRKKFEAWAQKRYEIGSKLINQIKFGNRELFETVIPLLKHIKGNFLEIELNLLKEIFEQGIMQGVIRDDMDVELMASTVQAGSMSIMEKWGLQNYAPDKQNKIKILCSILFDGLALKNNYKKS